MFSPSKPESKTIITNDSKMKRDSGFFDHQRLITNSFITFKIKSFLCGNSDIFHWRYCLRAEFMFRKEIVFHPR